jgi:homeobox-leucine zipper protein
VWCGVVSVCAFLMFFSCVCSQPNLQLDRVSSITSKYLGRPFTQMPPMPTMSASPLDLSVGPVLGGPPGLDLDLIGCGPDGPGMIPSGLPFQMPAPVTEMERPVMIDTAARALDELIRLAQAGDHLWVKGPPGDERETLNVATYDGVFSHPGAGFRPPDINVEGSRDSGHVFMSAVALVDVFMDTVRRIPPSSAVLLQSARSVIHCCVLLVQNKWMEFFPGIVSKAHTVDVLVSGMCGRNESLIMVTNTNDVEFSFFLDNKK